MNDLKGRSCCRCGEFKEWDEIVTDWSRPEGYSSRCKACNRDLQKTYFKTYRGLVRGLYKSRQASAKKYDTGMIDATLDEFRDHVDGVPYFRALFDEWKLSGCDKRLKPTIVLSSSYKLESIEFDTYANIQTRRDYGYLHNYKCKSLLQVDNGVVVGWYTSYVEAAKAVGVVKSRIGKCVRDGGKSRGFSWIRDTVDAKLKYAKENGVSALALALNSLPRLVLPHEKNKWSMDSVDTLKRLVDRGLHIDEIVKCTNTFTENAVRVKLNKLGYRASRGYYSIAN